MNNAEKFLAVFKQIEKYLANLAGLDRYEDFMTLVRLLSDNKNKVVNTYKNDLREYAELRNAIVHQGTGKPIAEPYDEVIQDLQKIYNILRKPPTAYDIASKPVYKCNANDTIVGVIRKMTEKVFTHVPVLEDDKFIGVFSESTLARWLSNSTGNGGFLLEETKIYELKKYFDRQDDAFSCYKFVPRDADAFSIKEEFLCFVNEIKRLGAVFVTDRGKKDEGIIGIITSWDLPKIDQCGK